MNIDNLTLGQIKQIQALLGNASTPNTQSQDGLNAMLGKKVIIRTYSAGVWFGELEQKAGNEVILKNARRMWKWWAKEGISLSACALYGVKHDNSKIVEAVESVWLEAIEIIPCTDIAIKSMEDAPNVKAE
ncbi:hypothetical protein LP109_05540 [Moraxella bovis]|uniref:DUF6948 domain-containing protein n=1 Tax=Moraxella bovis TaxID=476 RepID=UPI0009939200|nr:hypothetical protein [Moraxella bovis]AWY21689.1 hypothetical protein DQF64_07315 [Moraxella bovis]OOR90802.1 hypothetical protein B0182_04585 [Moraxella bovis]UZA15764.1 hypothetical protein LP109_08795 [Moraxella bovis]UZA17745.1 hypothetical protein LP109_05540 [Moraxella bovis]